MEGKTARGASSPAKPALHMPEPLSTTRAAISSSMVSCGESWAMSRGRVGPPPPCPLPARRAFWPPGGAGARPDWGQRKPSRLRYYHKRQTLVRGGPAARGRKPSAGPSPRPPAPPLPRSKSAGRLGAWRPHPREPAARHGVRMRPRATAPGPNAHAQTHAQQCPQPPTRPAAPPRPPIRPS